MKQTFKIYNTPDFQNPSLIVGWEEDIGDLGSEVLDFLIDKLRFKGFAEIELIPFFSLGGVLIEDNVIQFPEGKFYFSEREDLVLFKGDAPSHEHYKFLDSILDIAQNLCKVKEVYAVGGVATPIAHTSPQRVLTVVNEPELNKMLVRYGLETDTYYQTPPASRPSLNTFLLWVAKRRGIPGVSLWGEVPFYLAEVEEPRASKLILSFLGQRFNLGLDLAEVELEIKRQNEKIEELRRQDLEINRYIEMLERGIGLKAEESEKLVKALSQFLQEE